MPQTITAKQLQEMIVAAVNPAVETAIKGMAVPPQGGVDPAGMVDAGNGNHRRGGKSSEGDISLRFGRALLCIASGGGQIGAMDTWKKHFSFDSPLEKALSASDFGAGGALLDQEFSTEIIEFLRPASVVMASEPRIMDMTATGTIETPKVNTGSSASYVGENQTGGITEPEFGNLVLIRKKLKAEIPVSNDLLRFATLNADQIIRDDAVAAMSQRQDAAFIRDDGTLFTPKGLRFQVPAVNVIATAGAALANMETDLGAAVLALRDKDVRLIRPGWLISPRTEMALMTIRTGVNENYAFRAEMIAGRLVGYPFKVTTQIPEDLGAGTDESEIYFADFSEVVVGEAMGIIIDATSSGAYFDGAAIRSAFSRDQTVIRLIMQHDIGMRHDFAVSVITGVQWTP